MNTQNEARVEQGPLQTNEPFALGMAGLLERQGFTVAAAELRRLHKENEALRADAERWQRLYRKAVNVANGLTNYIEDRPELRQAERQLDAIQNAARSKT